MWRSFSSFFSEHSGRMTRRAILDNLRLVDGTSVALQAMRIMPGNVNACYWTTISLYQLGGKDAAQKVIESIKPKLTDEEYAELIEKLKEKIK